MKVKLREDVYIATPTEYSTCVSCVFLSDNGGICNAPNYIYIHLVQIGIKYSIIFKNVLKYLIYENRIRWSLC